MAMKALVLLVLAAQAACVTAPPGSAPPPGAAPAPPPDAAAAPLPPGPGRAILQADCTSCHDLGGLWAYQGYYDELRWRDLVGTMIAHGAELDASEADVLVAYLVEHFGPGTR